MNDTDLGQLEDIKKSWNNMVSQLRVEVEEKKAAADECKVRYLDDEGYVPHSCSLVNGSYDRSGGEFCMAATQQDHAERALTNLEIENKICDAFYAFVQACYAESKGDDNLAKEIIREAITYSLTLKTVSATLEFWTLS